jgi:hypothetical protein
VFHAEFYVAFKICFCSLLCSRDFHFVSVLGASGTGKTRLGLESLRLFKETNDELSANITHAFVGVDSLPDNPTGAELSADVLGCALAASYFGGTLDWRAFASQQNLKVSDFHFSSVVDWVGRHFRGLHQQGTPTGTDGKGAGAGDGVVAGANEGGDVALLLQLDEFHTRPSLVNNLLRAVRECNRLAGSSRVCVIPILTGTVDSALNRTEFIYATGYTGLQLMVPLMPSLDAACEIILNTFNLGPEVLVKLPLLRQLIGDAGQNFRFLQYVADALRSSTQVMQALKNRPESILCDTMRLLSHQVAVRCYARYSLQSWMRVLSCTDNSAIIRLLAACITQEEVRVCVWWCYKTNCSFANNFPITRTGCSASQD